MRLFDLPGQSGGSRASSVQTPPIQSNHLHSRRTFRFRWENVSWVEGHDVLHCTSHPVDPHSCDVRIQRVCTQFLSPNRSLRHEISRWCIRRPYRGLGTSATFAWVYDPSPRITLIHQEWTWYALLHMPWAKRNVPGALDSIVKSHDGGDWSTISLSVVLNCLLIWCIFLS